MMFTQAKKTLSLALPIIVGEVAQISLGLIDTAMVGAIDYRQLAAAALVISVINIPLYSELALLSPYLRWYPWPMEGKMPSR